MLNLREAGSLLIILVLPAFLVFSCSPATTKIAAKPSVIGFCKHDKLVVVPVKYVGESENQQLMKWAADQVNGKVPTVKVVDYWDAVYQAKQVGVELPLFNKYDTASFTPLSKTGINFILVGQLDKFNENYNEFSNPSYNTREAIVSFQLLDVRNRKVVWHCTARVLANRLDVNSKTRTYSFNARSGTYAMNKAFKKSIERLTKSIILID